MPQESVWKLDHDGQAAFDQGVAAQAAALHHDDLRESQRFVQGHAGIVQEGDSGIVPGDIGVESEVLGRVQADDAGDAVQLGSKRHRTKPPAASAGRAPTGEVPSMTTRCAGSIFSRLRTFSGSTDNLRVNRGHPPIASFAGSWPASIMIRRCISPQQNIRSAMTGTYPFASSSRTPCWSVKVGIPRAFAASTRHDG